MSIQGAVNSAISSAEKSIVAGKGLEMLREQAEDKVVSDAKTARQEISESNEKIPELEKTLKDVNKQYDELKNQMPTLEAKEKGTYYPFDEKTNNYRDPKTQRFVSGKFVDEESHSKERALETMETLERQRASIVDQHEMFKAQLERATNRMTKVKDRANRLGVKI